MLRGKVVLVDFWTYSCINCLRSLPYLKAWNAKYKDSGLVIIGVHTPEFPFEKDEAVAFDVSAAITVRAALKSAWRARRVIASSSAVSMPYSGYWNSHHH